MTNPHLPSPGVLVPDHLVFHPGLPAAVLVTWIQLRSLAPDGRGTPPMSFPELAARLGIHPNRLNRHMAYLQDLSALSWRVVEQGKLILSFPVEPAGNQEQRVRVHEDENLPIPVSVRPEPPAANSYFPARILGYLSFEDDDIDPLHIEHDLEILEKESVPISGNISRLLNCKPAEPSFVGK